MKVRNIAAAGMAMLIGAATAWSGEPETDLFPVVQGGKWGYMDRTGKVVIAPQYDCAWDFSEGLACVQVGLLRGYIDEKGTVVIKPQYAMAGDFCGGKARVHEGGQTWGDFVLFDFGREPGKWTTVQRPASMPALKREPKPSPETAPPVVVAPRGKSKTYWFKDKSGKKAFEQDFENALNFSEGLASVKVGGKWGCIDEKGTTVIEPKYEFVGPFSEGLARVVVDGKHGYMDKTGKVAIEPQWDCGWEFSKGLARIAIGDKEGYIDKTGRYVWEPKESVYVARTKPAAKANEERKTE